MAGEPTYATADTAARLLNRDPRSIQKEYTPIAWLETPKGERRKPLYDLARLLLEAAEKFEQTKKD
jgi:hypothetical protein